MFKAADMSDLCNSCYVDGFHNWNKFLIFTKKPVAK
jgi:hypothetical protein